MFTIYCLPGKLLAYLRWLFPGNYISAVQTGRQRESRFIHFLLSTAIYAFIGVEMMIGLKPRQAIAQPTERAPITVTPAPVVESVEPLRAEGPEPQTSGNLVSHGVVESDVEASPMKSEVSAPVQPAPMPTPQESAALSNAIEKAIASGKPKRWKDAELQGYVVVSEPQLGTSCRSYYYTVEAPEGNRKSDVSTSC